jgi:dihydropyrimidinase
VESSMLQSNVDYSVYEGWKITGWPTVTLRRGEVVYEHGEVSGRPGSGQYLRRGPTRML